MSRLLTFSGDEFASGESPCFVRPGFAGDRLSRLLIHVEVWGARTTAVLDTGGAFLMLDPMFAAIVGIDHADALARDRIRRGTIHRLPFAGGWSMLRGENAGATEAIPRPMVKAGAWLKEHSEEYVGRWVALRDDELVAVADSFPELRSQLPSLAGVLVTLVT